MRQIGRGSLRFYQGRLPETLRHQVIGSAGMAAIVWRGHPLAGRDGVPLEGLRAYSLIELANDEFSNRLVADMPEANDITFENPIHTDDIETVPPVVRAMGGVSGGKGDVTYRVPMFPFPDVMLQYWDSDDEFPAPLQLFVDDRMTDFMHCETVWLALSHMMARLKELMA